MTNTLYFYGGGDIAVTVLNAVAAIMKGGVFASMITMAIAASVAIISLYAVRDQNAMIYPKYLLRFIVVTTLLSPVSSVFVYDKITNHRYKVDNIPIMISGIATIINEIGYSLTELFETTMSLPNDLQYQKTGMVFGSRILAQGKNLVITDSRFKENLQRFTQQCVALEGLIGGRFDLHELKSTNNIWQLLKDRNPSNINGFRYDNADGTKSVISCKEGIDKFDAEWIQQIPNIGANLDKIFFGNSNFIEKIGINLEDNFYHSQDQTLSIDLKNGLTSTYQYMVGLQSNAEDLIKQQILINEFDNSVVKKLNELSGVNAYTMAKAQAQQNASSILNFDTSSYNLPIMYTICKIILLAFSVLIVIAVVFPGGESYIATYFKMLLCVELWPAAFAVINLIMTCTASAMTNQTLNIVGSASLIKLHQAICNSTAMISCSIPIITWMLLNKSGGALLRMVDSMNSGYMGANTAAAGEIASGNSSMGNIYYRNEQIDHFSRNKIDNSMSVSNWRMNTEMQDGGRRTLLSSGATMYETGSGINKSKLSYTANSNDVLTESVSQSYAKEQSNYNALTNSEEQTKQNIIQDMKDLGNEFSKSDTILNSLANSTDQDISYTFQQVKSIANSISDEYGIDYRYSLNIALNAMIGKSFDIKNLPFGLGEIKGEVGVNAGAGFERNVHDAFNKAVNLVDSRDLHVDRSFVEKLHGSLNKDTNHSNLSRYTENLSNHISDLNQTSYQKQASFQKLERYEQLSSLVSTGGIDLSKDLNDDLLQYVAKQTNHSTGKSYGELDAIDILDNNPVLANYYAKGFIKEFQENFINEIPQFEAQKIERVNFNNQDKLDRLNTESEVLKTEFNSTLKNSNDTLKKPSNESLKKHEKHFEDYYKYQNNKRDSAKTRKNMKYEDVEN